MRQIFISIFALLLILSSCNQKKDSTKNGKSSKSDSTAIAKKATPPVDSASYHKKLKEIANGDTTGLWPIKSKLTPNNGAILPYKRIVAYYGNLYSKKMGILGEYPPKEVWKKLNAEVKSWEKADPKTPVQPAIHYIATVAQGAAGKNGKFCMRMPNKQIDSALAIAKMGDAIVFLDIQVALSNLQTEVPVLEKYLKMPNVHLGIDPEFSMKDGSKPGKKIGTMDANDVNYCTEYLAKIVRENNLPPKILIVHRFTQGMIRNYRDIKLHPEVQIVMNMDGWGAPYLKHSTYQRYIYREPVQFTGFKLFYKNDLKNPPHVMLTPADLMKLKPQPIYIQYQ